MMTTFSCWLLYIASYEIIYVMITCYIILNRYTVSIINEDFKALSLIEQTVYIFNKERVILLILFVLIIFSIVWTQYIKSWKNNTRVHFRMKDNSKIDESAFILPYIFTSIPSFFDVFGWFISFTIYGIIGLIFVQSRKIQMSPVFLLSRYHILTDGTNKIITRNTVEAFNLKLDEQQNGIEVRELAKHIYITLDR